MRTSTLAFLLILRAAGAACAESPSSFAYGIPIRADGGESLYRLELPRAVYLGAVRPDLGDVRVFNGAGEIVPHAFLPRVAVETQKRAPVALRFFPLYGDDPGQVDGLSLRVERNASGTIVQLDERARTQASKKLLAYLVDATELKDPLSALQMDVKGGGSYAASVRVEASDDLSGWRTLAAGAPLVSLQHDGARLERSRVELVSTKARYLRIGWAAMPQGTSLGALQAELGDTRVDASRKWEAVTGSAVSGKAGDYVFDTQGVFPADRVRLELPQANTVVQIQIFSRSRADREWRTVARATAYRLRRDGVEITSPDLSIGEDAERYWLLRVDQRGGGLGAGEPKLILGWVAHEIAWVARGSPPFTLAYGSRDAKPSAYAIEAVVPGYRGDADLSAKTASAGGEASVPVKAVAGESPAPLGGSIALEERIDVKRWLLWGSLLAGVALLGWMAWRLAKQMGKGQQ